MTSCGMRGTRTSPSATSRSSLPVREEETPPNPRVSYKGGASWNGSKTTNFFIGKQEEAPTARKAVGADS